MKQGKTMKYKITTTVIMAIFSTSLSFAQMKEDVSKSVSNLISTSKDAISGIKEGITDGRKQGASADGSIIISTTEEMKPYVTFKVRKIENPDNNRYTLTLIFTNQHEQPVRLINLHDDQAVLLLDEDRITSPLVLQKSNDEVTIPRNAATRVQWTFDNVETEPAFLRIYNTEYILDEIKK